MPVGLEPVAVAARTDAEVWVVNLLSDSVSIVDVASRPPPASAATVWFQVAGPIESTITSALIG